MIRKLALLFAPLLALSVAMAPTVPALNLEGSLVTLGDGPVVTLGDGEMRPQVRQDLATLPSVSPYAAFVHFADGVDKAAQVDLLENHGLLAAHVFQTVDVVWASGTVGDFKGLTREDSVIYLEENIKMSPLLDTAPWSTRVRVAHEPVSGGPYFDPDGHILDGDGVGIAIVDTGADATHPDLTPNIVTNYKIVCTTPGVIDEETGACFGPVTFVDVGNTGSTDSSSGHGTGVAGVAAGTGAASTGNYPGVSPQIKGTFTGVAPGASLHIYSVGEAAAAFNFTVAFDDIAVNGQALSPPVSIMNVSLGEAGGATYDPESIFAKLIKRVVESGVTVVVAAGNGDLTGNGGDGTADITTSYCDDPTPGVICVGSYNDADSGTLSGGVSGFSSRGMSGAPETYPDILAPGEFITVPCFAHQPICVTAGLASPEWAGFYSIVLGTSFASPHVAGAAALLLQADPTMTPADIEDIFKDTARKITAGVPYEPDPSNPGQTHSFDKGAGLLDFPAVLGAQGIPGSGPTNNPEDVRITTPSEGDEFTSSDVVAVEGTASFDSGTPAPPTSDILFDLDGGDLLLGPAAADVESLSVDETTIGGVPGVLYGLTVVDATAFPGSGTAGFRLLQSVNGSLRNTVVLLSASGASASTAGNSDATSATLVGNTIEFFVPYSALGSPPKGAPAHSVYVVSYEPGIAFPFTDSEALDLAPSDIPPSAANFPLLLRQAFLQYARPYTITRPDLPTVSPTSELRFSLDGASAVLPLVGAGPSYSWSTSVGPLAVGTHELRADLFLDSVLVDTHIVNIVVSDEPPEFTYDVLITNPPDGSTVPNSTVEIRGSVATDDPSADRAVTVQVTGASFDSGEQTASLVGSNWTHPFNFGDVDPGTYEITSRFFVDEVVQDTDAIEIFVVEAPDESSCRPRAIGYWRQQFGGGPSQKFTTEERETLAFHAVGLSDGYFEDRDELVDALNARGDLAPEAIAARQYAALLLNLAAGDLSSEMSQNEGLSGSEELDPSVYNTAVVGENVQEATDWVNSQLPSGDLGGANEVADAINNGQGLSSCP